MNGDEGPAYELRLAWSISRWTRQIWEGRARIVTMMAKTGEPWKGEMEKMGLVIPGRPAFYEPVTTKGRVTGVIKTSSEVDESISDKTAYVMPERSIIDSRFAGTKIDSAKGGEQVTVLERLFDDVNPILCEPAQGVALDEGNLLIADKLAERVLGDQPALRINRECTNTQFMLANYTLPAHRDTTAKKDEACKEWRDLLAYLLLARPEHVSLENKAGKPGRGFGAKHST
jgi:hypothetical protein